MRIHEGVLQAPHEGHQEGQQVELIYPQESQCHEEHDEYKENVDNGDIARTSSVDDLAYDEASEDFSQAEDAHCDDGTLQFVLRNSISDHRHQAAGVVSYANASPQQLGHQPAHPLRLPHSNYRLHVLPHTLPRHFNLLLLLSSTLTLIGVSMHVGAIAGWLVVESYLVLYVLGW